MAEKVLKLAETTTARQTPMVQPEAADRWSRMSFKGIKPATLSSVIGNAEEGDLEDWADLSAFMLRDPHIRAVYETRSMSITGAELAVDPASTDDAEAAAAAVELVRVALLGSQDLESTLAGLIHAEGTGWALAQHHWSRKDGIWQSSPEIIDPRDVRFASNWTMDARTYDDEHRFGGRWVSTEDYKPGSFIRHVPQKLDRPTVAGDLMAVAWSWLFKRWLELWRQQAMEKFAGPFMIGRVPQNAPDVVRSNMKAALQRLSQNQIAIMEEGSDIEFKEISRDAGSGWTDGINALNREITKLMLGSELNTEVGSTGGNRALGESQWASSTLPRLKAMSKRLAATLERDWVMPLLRFNAHLFGGRMPPIPTLRFQLVNDEPPAIDWNAIDKGVHVTQNEGRSSMGLSPLDQGGDEPIKPLPVAAPAAPGFSKAEAAASAVPLARRQLTLPLTSRRKKTQQTSSAFQTQIKSAQQASSGARGKRHS